MGGLPPHIGCGGGGEVHGDLIVRREKFYHTLFSTYIMDNIFMIWYLRFSILILLIIKGGGLRGLLEYFFERKGLLYRLPQYFFLASPQIGC